jgi:hypothetical protein
MTEFATTETRVSAAGFDIGAAGITPPSNPNRRGVFLADVVVELGLADQEAIDHAVRAAQETERSLERYLLEEGILDEDSLSRAIAERNGLDHVDLEEFEIDSEAAEMVARSAAQRYSAVPVAFASDGALIVAVQDPFDTLGISDIEVMTRSSVRPAIATATGIDHLIELLPEQPVSRAPVEENDVETAPIEELKAEEDSFDRVEAPSANGHFGSPDPVEFVVEGPEPEAETEQEPAVEQRPEPESEEEREPEAEQEREPEAEQEREPEAEHEPETVVEVETPSEPEPVVEIAAEADPGPEPEAIAQPTPGELELIRFPEIEPDLELVGTEPELEPEAVFDLKPELVEFPEPTADAGVSDLESELGSLQETTRRADELASTVERRIAELKSGDGRAEQLEADLEAAQRRVEELEAQVNGVDTLAEELRATTAKLEEVNRVLEGSVG